MFRIHNLLHLCIIYKKCNSKNQTLLGRNIEVQIECSIVIIVLLFIPMVYITVRTFNFKDRPRPLISKIKDNHNKITNILMDLYIYIVFYQHLLINSLCNGSLLTCSGFTCGTTATCGTTPTCRKSGFC